MRHKLIETKSGAEVKPGMTCIDFRNVMWKLVSFRVKTPPSNGIVTVVQVGDSKGVERDLYPSVFDFQIVEADDE